ncbi:MAG TPA: DHH family phosphoesterase [Candidatus Krumholzibacteria bacterium]|nr:DHH family phosphoesterase [Candidatus Krumholzibacteria bacterium]
MSFAPYPPPEALTALLREKRSFRLATHVNPDADGLGSLLGLGLALAAAGKQVAMVRHEDGPTAFQHLPGYARAERVSELQKKAEVLVLFDCHEVSRIGPAAQGLTGEEMIVVIDHHLTEDGGGDGELEWLEPRAAASAALVHSLVSSMKELELSSEVASCLYAGLITDTGGFRFSNTDATTLRVGADLVEHGADAAFLADAFLHQRTPATLRLLARVLDSFQYLLDGRVVFAEMTRAMCEQTGGRMEDTEGFVNFATSAKGVKLVALFKEEPEGGWRLSLRGNEPYDVRNIAKIFGGGGHARAAGCTLQGELEEVKKRIAAAFGEELARGGASG